MCGPGITRRNKRPTNLLNGLPRMFLRKDNFFLPEYAPEPQRKLFETMGDRRTTNTRATWPTKVDLGSASALEQLLLQTSPKQCRLRVIHAACAICLKPDEYLVVTFSEFHFTVEHGLGLPTTTSSVDQIKSIRSNQY